MLLIDDKVVSLDIIEKYFCCDLNECLGQCCIEGDAGAPLLESELPLLKQALPIVEKDLTPAGLRAIEQQGVAYTDQDGDLVTTLAESGMCAFATLASNGVCLCALEKAHREGRLNFCKPQSCWLYPIRATKYPSFTALNYHRWKICRAAETLGRARATRVYQALKTSLINAYGQEWYDKLTFTAAEYLKQKS